MKKLLRHLSSCGLAARGSWPLLLAVALAALWAAPAQAEDYGLYVCGVQVTEMNKDDLSAIPGVTGTATYDPTTKTLRLKDARIEAAGDNSCIDNAGVDGLTVEVEGKCVMESKGHGISMGVSTTIAGKSGTGVRSLVVSAAGTGVHVSNVTSFFTVIDVVLTVIDVDLTVTGQEYGIAGNGRDVYLTVKDATVRATGRQGSIYGIVSRNSSSGVLMPENAYYGGYAGKTALMLDGALVTGEAVIGRKYDLRICGVQVTGANKDDLSAIPGVTGTATYNPYTNVLWLKDATIVAAAGESCIASIDGGLDGLTVEVEGKCRMQAEMAPSTFCIGLQANTTIKGKSGAEAPSLACVSQYIGFAVRDGGSCTIRDLDLTATGPFGLAGGGSGSLTVENATVRATGEWWGSIIDFASVTLKDCQVATPAGAAFDGGTLKKDGEVVTGEALILPDAAMGIGTTAGDAPRREGTYTLTGVRLTAPLDQLPRGVYVVDGQKVVKK